MDYTKWNTIKLKYAYHFSIGFTPNTSNLSYYENGVYSWAQISDLNSKVFSTTQKKITLQAITDYQPTLAPKNSLLVSFLLSPGVTSFCGIDTYFNQAIACFPPTNKNSLNYLYYILPIAIRNLSRVNIYGAPIYTSGILKNLLIPLPPIDTQKTVSSFLDRKCSLLQQLFQKIDLFLKKLEDYQASLIYEKIHQNNPQNISIKLKYIFSIHSGSTPSTNQSHYWDGPLLFIKPTDIDSSQKYLVTTQSKITMGAVLDSSLKVSPKNSIIFSCRAPIGKINILLEPAYFSQGCKSLILLDSSKNFLDYFYYYLKTSISIFEQIGVGSTFKEIYSHQLGSFQMNIPPYLQQQSIAIDLDLKVSLLNRLQKCCHSLKTHLEEYQSSLLYETFQHLP